MRATPPLLRRALPLLGLLLFGLVGALPLGAEEPQQAQAKVDVVMDVLASGAAEGKVILDFAPLTYQLVKGAVPDAGRFLKDLAIRRGNVELGAGTLARYDDATTSAQLDLKQLNAARNLGEGRWEVPVEPAFEFINEKLDGDRPTYFFYQFGEYRRTRKAALPFRGQFRYRLPVGATEATWDGERHVIRYRLPHAEGTGPAKLGVDFEVKPRLMTAIYKVYGRDQEFANMWLAKARLTNSGTSLVKDVRVRYKLEGYSEWSPWDRYPELVPGQTAVSRYHPVLDAKVAKLQSQTPANILMEWSWTDLAGQTKSESDGRKVTLLGGHDLVFSDVRAVDRSSEYVENVTYAPFVAAWVTPDDLAIKEFAAMASRVAQGEGAGRGDQSTIEVLHAIYELWVVNGFTYQHPPGLVDTSISFDPQLIQNVKYPRDVLRDKGGTCIDVAICYAAMANALGIRPFLALRPGHCFPVFELPSGNLLAVEATGATKGGLKADAKDRGRVLTFATAVKLAMADMEERDNAGELILVDVQTMWTRGVAAPELDALPANILKEWGLSTGAATEPKGEAGGTQGGGEAKQETAQADPYLGQWTMMLEERIQGTGQTIRYPVVLTIAADGNGYKAGTEANGQVQSPTGWVTFKVIQVLTGARSDEGALVMRGTRKVIQNVTAGTFVELPVDQVVAVVRGDVLMGKVSSDGRTWSEFSMQRR